ncbi:uncharacterized protein LOC128882827 [Hylaeus volcanicus]|uniref:uncharacterized protein LOC128882827 n=1 Tax=Hylaeus volcanicus TaxID=313075 RepID=UPI0023B775B2|nr:uncharacterized protein LOC128882827 [Hylaeus volcanicus]
MSEVFAEHIADSLLDCSIHSEDSDEIIEDSDSDVGPRRRSRAVPLQDSSDPDDSDNSTDCEMPPESHNYRGVWSDVDEIPNIPDFTGEPGQKIFPTDKKSIKEVVELFIGNDLFELMINESNIYYLQNKDNVSETSKMSKWRDITLAEMKKCLGLIIMMGQVKKDIKDEY